MTLKQNFLKCKKEKKPFVGNFSLTSLNSMAEEKDKEQKKQEEGTSPREEPQKSPHEEYVKTRDLQRVLTKINQGLAEVKSFIEASKEAKHQDDVSKRVERIEFLLKNKDAENFIDVIEALADKKKISFEDAYKEIQEKFMKKQETSLPEEGKTTSETTEKEELIERLNKGDIEAQRKLRQKYGLE